MYCAGCGAELGQGAAFCTTCGRAAGGPVAKGGPPVAATVGRRASRGGRSGRALVAIGVVLTLVVGAVALSGGPRPAGEPTLGLGSATARSPVAERLVASATWGTVPADQVLVLLRAGSGRADADRVAERLGASVVGEIAWLSLYQLETSGRTAAALDEAVSRAAKLEGVTLAAANLRVLSEDAAGTRCDPLADPSYRIGANARAYEVIGLGPAIDLLRGSGATLSPVRVGVLDDAIAKGTGEFSRDVQIRGDATESATWDHGTEVAGLIGAAFGNGGVAGVAGVLGDKLTLAGANVYRAGDGLPRVPVANPADPTQVTLAGQTHVYSVFADAVRQIDEGATVVNMSFGDGLGGAAGAKEGARLWREFLARMQLQHPKVLFVASAGNANLTLDGENHLPGGMKADNLVTVGAIDGSGRKASFSNAMGPGGEVTLAAVGRDVMVGIKPDGTPILGSGTSFAAPQVAAAAALLRAVDPSLDAKQVKDILAQTAAPGIPGKDAQGRDVSIVAPAGLGGKVLRVDNALERVVNDLRARQSPPLPKIDRAKVAALAVIDVKGVQKDALGWTLVASLPAVGEKGADVKIEWQGQGGPGGGTTRHLGAAGSVEWPYSFLDEKGTAAATVTRLDTGGCARVSFKAGGTAPAPLGDPVTLRRVLESAASALKWDEGGANRWSCGDPATGGEGSCVLERRPTTTLRTSIALSRVGAPATRELDRLAAAPGAGVSVARTPHRGLPAVWLTASTPYDSLAGVTVAVGNVQSYKIDARSSAVGDLVVSVRSSWTCMYTRSQVAAGEATCTNPGTPAPTGVLDAVLNALVAGRLVAPGAVQ